MIKLEEIQLLPSELLTRRNPQEIADYYNTDSNNTEVVEYWLTDRGLVADLVAAFGGNTQISDSILTKFDQVMTLSRSAKAMIGRLYTDSRGLNFGDAALRAWFQGSTPTIFTEDECAAILNLAVRHKTTTPDEVEVAIKAPNGQWLI